MHALVQRAAERHVHFLEAAADAEHRHAARHRARNQRQRGRVAMRIVQRAGHARRAGVARRLHVRGAAREEHAVDEREHSVTSSGVSSAGISSGRQSAACTTAAMYFSPTA